MVDCRRCDRPFTAQRSHRARGVCAPCWPTVCRRGEQELYPLTRKTISAAAVLEEYVFFARRERNLTRVRLAEYLGVQPAVVYKALSRARQNGLLVDV